jgi:hypothetical protein
MKKFVPMGRIVAVAFSLALAACGDPLGTGGLPVRFTVADRPTPDFAVVSEAPRTVTIRGTFGFGPCDFPDPGARVEGNTVIFRLEMERRSNGGTCPATVEVRGYRAEIANIAAGTYQVRVEHVGTSDNWGGPTLPNGVRFTGNVTVE